MWENRFQNDASNDCLVSVDGTDFRFHQKEPFWKGWYSHKFKAPALRYEVAVCIKTGHIVWIHGPFPAGAWSDITIFRHALINQLEEGERVEADLGYRGEAPRYIKIPDARNRDEVERMRAIVRLRHETVNKRIKQFACMKQVFRHEINMHSAAFRAVVVVTQLNINNGEHLFHVEYDDMNV